MRARRWIGSLVVFVGSLLCNACGSDDDVTLQGAGATFPAPLYKRWFLEYYKAHPAVRTNYQAIGSGAGIRQFSEGLTHFGASDAFSKPNVEGGAYLLPMTAGSVAICYNLPGGPKELNLSRAVYVDIFLGKITDWDDAAIAKDNPGVKMPANLPITAVRRAESSGTTHAFTSHLDAISPTWHRDAGGPGVGNSVVWPPGFLGAKGNAGVASLITQTPGAIGYLEFGYAKLAQESAPQLMMAHLQNRAGQFVVPGPESGLAALGGPNQANIPDDFHLEIPDPRGNAAYPIVTYTWMLVHKKYADRKLGENLKNILEYCLTDGQKISVELGYLPLPAEVAAKVRATVKKIEVGQ